MKILSLLLAVLVLIFALEAEASPAQSANQPTNAKKTEKLPQGICNCRCDLSHHDKFCAVNSKNEKETFQNECQLDCFNCTSGTDYRRRYSGNCKK